MNSGGVGADVTWVLGVDDVELLLVEVVELSRSTRSERDSICEAERIEREATLRGRRETARVTRVLVKSMV